MSNEFYKIMLFLLQRHWAYGQLAPHSPGLCGVTSPGFSVTFLFPALGFQHLFPKPALPPIFAISINGINFHTVIPGKN